MFLLCVFIFCVETFSYSKEQKNKMSGLFTNISFLCLIKVSGLQEGVSYRLRVHAKNLAGVGGPSKATDAILAETRPGEVLFKDMDTAVSGKHLSLTTCTANFIILVWLSLGTNEIVVDVDDDGVISLIFECSDLKEDSQFVWSKNYKAFTDTSRLTIQTSGGK